jgi:hypothetical protein
MTPLIIHNKDVQKILNCAPATATRKIDLLRCALKKKHHQLVTIKEFCNYYDLPFKEVTERLKSA